MNTKSFNNKHIVITGGTDGMGAAAAIELCKLGANVHIVGRSEAKIEALERKTSGYSGQVFGWARDFSLMKNAEKTAIEIAEKLPHIDYLIHAVGILITNAQHTSEGLEKDFAVSYLSRFVFNEMLHRKYKMTADTKILNIAASSPKVPSFAQMEFDDTTEVKARVGMKSHGQAQLANDLYTALAAERYNIISVGYGPGSVDTNIRREIPKLFQVVMKPFYYFSTRKPEDVAKQLVEILADDSLIAGKSFYYNKNGKFPIADFINNAQRQSELLNTTLSIINPILKNQ